MKKYEIEWETDDFNGDYFTTYDEDEAEKEFSEITEDGATVWATLKEYYIYGGICQGEKLLQEYNREDGEK